MKMRIELFYQSERIKYKDIVIGDLENNQNLQDGNPGSSGGR